MNRSETLAKDVRNERGEKYETARPRRYSNDIFPLNNTDKKSSDALAYLTIVSTIHDVIRGEGFLL